MTNNQSNEQLEFQRKNPHLYTTMTQSVDVIGNIVTLEQVTSKITDALNKLRQYHYKKYGTEDCGVMCMYKADDLCNMISMCNGDIRRASESFVKNFKHMQDRIKQRQIINPQKEVK